MRVEPPAAHESGGPSLRVAIGRLLYWGLPPLLCVALYWHGLKAWFQMDDFAWLSLHLQVHDFPSFISTLFRPMAQGTVRPLSERLFFLSFWHLYGMDALPFRLVVFATQFANLALICYIVGRLTGSALAGFVAPLLWLVSPVIYLPMTWTSAYNQILCAFFLLSALLLLLLYIDSGRKRHYVGMWAMFLLGFGALELNVVFPAIACLYTLLFARRYTRLVAPMFVVAIAYAIWHRSAGQSLAGDVYTMSFHPSGLISSLAKYLWLSVSAGSAVRLAESSPQAFNAFSIAVWILLAAAIGVLLWKRRWMVVFFVGWFLMTVAPYLPLVNHIEDYYLTVPAIGLAMLGGWAFALAMRAMLAVKVIAVVAVLLFALPCGWQAWTMSQWYSAKSRRVRSLVRGLASVHQRYPDRWVVLQGVDNDLFWYGIYDRPEVALGWSRSVYMTADTQPLLSKVRDEDISGRFLPQSVTVAAIRNKQAVVYDASGPRLRNITEPYVTVQSQLAQAALPRFVDAANPLFAPFLKDGWHGPGDSFRWTSQRATVQMAGPLQTGGKVQLKGAVTELHTGERPIYVTLSVNGAKVGTQSISQRAMTFELTFALPSEIAGKEEMLVGIELDRTVSHPADPRALGLAMGTIALVP